MTTTTMSLGQPEGDAKLAPRPRLNPGLLSCFHRSVAVEGIRSTKYLPDKAKTQDSVSNGNKESVMHPYRRGYDRIYIPHLLNPTVSDQPALIYFSNFDRHMFHILPWIPSPPLVLPAA